MVPAGLSTQLQLERAILAYLPLVEFDKILRFPLLKLTEKTVISRQDLLTQLSQVRKKGFAVAAEELEQGYVAIGAPVVNHNGSVIAAISLGGPTTRMTVDRFSEYGTEVRAAGERISHRLGFQE